MMAEKVEPDTFIPPCHKVQKILKQKWKELLKEYRCQFAQNETTIGTTPLTNMTIAPRDSDPVSQKPYPIAWNTTNGLRTRLTNYWEQKWYREADPIGQHPS